MAARQLSQAIRQLRNALVTHDGAGPADRDLLRLYVQQRDEAAFEALVRRHSGMVMGVCRRVLHDHHDAEDAFQATFLVLVRKASSLRSPDMIGNWLYGVAYRIALVAKRAAGKRRLKEAMVLPKAETSDGTWTDLLPALDQELERLPDKYRAVLVLCDLEGKTRREAARHFGWPEGTVASRLVNARTLLAKRLSRYGLSISGGVLATALCRNASACVPYWMVDSTIKAAVQFAAGQAAATSAISANVAALTKGMLKAMMLSKLKFATAILLVVAFLGTSGGLLVWQSRASENAVQQSRGGQSVKIKEDDLKKVLLELDERWWKGGVETLEKLAADDLITVSGVGRYDKASLLEASKIRHAADWTRKDVEVSRISKDVAVVTYIYDCKVLLEDGTVVQNCRDRRFSMTWAKRKNGWVVVFAQETILPGGE